MDSEEKQEQSKRKTPAGAWPVMLAVFLGGICMAFAQYKVTGVLASPDPNAPSMARDLVMDNATAGWVLSLFTLVGIFLAFPAVAIIKKWGIKIGGLVALAFAIVGGIIGIFAGNAPAIIVSRIIEGFGLGFIGVIAPSAIAMWFPIEKRGAPMGIWSSWQMWGICGSFFFGIPITNAFGEAFDYSWKALWIAGIILLIIAIVVYAVVVKVPPADQNYADINESEDGKGVSIFASLKYGNAWIMALAGLAFGISNSTVIAWISPFWQSTGTADGAMANNMTGAMYLIECFGCIIFGFVLNAIRHRRRFMVIDSLVWAVAFFLMFRISGIPGAIIMLIVYSIVESAYCAAMWTLCPQAVPDPRAGASMIALFTVAVDIGMMLGSPLGGWFIDIFGDYGALAYMVCGAQLVATVCYALVKMYNEKGQAEKI